jgi:putative ABC transport system substrate-binding protein
MPVIGLLNGVSNETYAQQIASIRQGLREQGFVEGQNMAFEYRSAEGQQRFLPPTAGDMQAWPARVAAPQRRLARIAAVLRGR